MLLNSAINQFFKRYFLQSQYSEKTKSAYILDLKQFKEFLSDEKELTHISLKEVEQWVATLKSKYAPTTIQRKIVSVKIFFNYLERNDMITSSPIRNSRFNFGRITKIPKCLTIEDTTRLLNRTRLNYQQVQKNKNQSDFRNFLFLRDLALIELMLSTGIRCGEVRSIQIGDLNTTDRSVFIHGKGNRFRYCFITEDVNFEAVRKYFNMRKKIETSHNHLFINRFNGPLSTQGIADVIKKLSQQAKISTHITPHMLRHTAATFFLRNGADIRVVQEFLGHASINTTQRYTHVSKEHLVSNLISFHPLKNLNTSHHY